MPFLAIALGIPLLVLFLLVSGILLIPFFAIRAGIRAKKRIADRPPSTRVLRQTLEEISDPFPSTEAFMRISSEQLIEAWKDRLPHRPLFNRIVGTAGTLYSAEGFDPLKLRRRR